MNNKLKLSMLLALSAILAVASSRIARATAAPPALSVCVTVHSQTLDLIGKDGIVLKTYKISTSRYGIGTGVGTNKTPLGQFRIAQKIGDKAKPGEIFESRIPTGRVGRDGDPADYVESRILWLDGLQPENRNTHGRYIYIHGTNSESKLGTPASFGCVRMSNRDVIDLYNRVNLGTLVVIKP